ncbi:MAG: hypothetical protein PHV37_09900 [Candidatus Gastranaerophilales bacterium]|nr:hypothetical protein [Candidatus Gastranaerophilales bacterium]
MPKILKKNDSGLRVLEVLKILLQGAASIEDIMHKLENKENIENIYAKETLHKYFATLDLMGLIVVKRKSDNKYSLKKLPIEIDLEPNEIKALCILQNYVKLSLNAKTNTLFNEILKKIENSLSYQTSTTYKAMLSNSVIKSDIERLCQSSLLAKFEAYCIDGQKLKVSYVSQSKKLTEIFIVEPKSVIFEDKRTYLLAYSPVLNQNQKLLINNIVKVVQLPQKAGAQILTNSVVFELKDTLARSYKLKDGERIVDSRYGKLIISNDQEDKNILYRRLLKYGENCKILHSSIAQTEFAEMIDKMIFNLKGAD